MNEANKNVNMKKENKNEERNKKRKSDTKDRLLILTLLKVPVTLIIYASKSLSMLTYIANYIVIRVLDSIIFSQTLSKTLPVYTLSWPLRLLSLVGVGAIFCSQFYWTYSLLSIAHFHWAVQLIISFVVFQAIVALMRHGYLTMIKKYSPAKLKSPKEHLFQLYSFITDVLGVILALLNVLLIVNASKTVNYEYNPKTLNSYLIHISQLLHKSILDITKLFYIKIFFRFFPWRYRHSLKNIEKESKNALPLIVLLTLLFMVTLIDLVFFALFGIYCAYLHPRKRLYRYNIERTYNKFQCTTVFVLNTISEMVQCIVLMLVIPLKYKQALWVLSLVTAKENNYSVRYWGETVFVLWLAVLTVPSLLCQCILLLSVYKHRKIDYLIKEETMKISQNYEVSDRRKLKHSICHNSQQRDRFVVREYIVFRCFVSLLKELPFFLIVLFCTVLKLWNVAWLRFVIDTNYNVRIWLVMSYFEKNIKDYLCVVPCFLSLITLGLYNPIEVKDILKYRCLERRALIAKIPTKNLSINNNQLDFYQSSSAVLPKMLVSNLQQIGKDIFLLPLFILEKLTLVSLMGCPNPIASVELFEGLWLLYYEQRVRQSGYGQQYIQLLREDERKKMVVTQRQRLRFWKFAYKSVRLRKFSEAIKFFIPKQRAENAITNIKVENRHSSISNHYWNQYSKTMTLLKYLGGFVVEVVVMLIAVPMMVPLTLWRMPTFFVLFKIHGWKKKYFFSIIFLLYTQLLFDVIYALPRILVLCQSPKVCFNFYSKTMLKYTKVGVNEFNRIQKAKIWFLMEKVLKNNFLFYMLLLKMLVIKLLWVRKNDMNQKLSENNIKVGCCVKDFFARPQKTPNIVELKALYNSEAENIFAADEDGEQKTMNESMNQQKLKNANQLKQEARKIVDQNFDQMIYDIPYLLLMVLLLITLPWRAFYIKRALLLMRDENNRKQFIKLLKMVSKDYQCVLLYIVLVFSIVKTKRAFQLFSRNFKLNFYVGTLKYSHLKELRKEFQQAMYFYYSSLIVIVSCMFGPYRVGQIYSSVVTLYKTYRDEQYRDYHNKLMYENTVREGKSLELLTVIGHSSLLNVLSYLDVKDLIVLTRVCRYTYDTIMETEQVWKQHWKRAYSSKYVDYILNNDIGQLSYYTMCIRKYQWEHFGYDDEQTNRYCNLAIRELRISAFETCLDLKGQLKMRVSERVYNKVFTFLRYDLFDGYGPQENWPRADDNEEYLTLLNIHRREIVELSENEAFLSWFFQRPIEWLIRKLSYFYGNETHRRKKQLLYVITNIIGVLALLLVIFFCWSWFWQINIFFGYKCLGVTYAFWFCFMFYRRYVLQSETWASLHPFNLIEDVLFCFRVCKRRIKLVLIKLKKFIMRNGKRYIVTPIRVAGAKIIGILRRTALKVMQVSYMFFERVAKPLYLLITDKLRMLWILTKNIVTTFIAILSMFCHFIWLTFRKTLAVLSKVVRIVNNAYFHLLQCSLKFALNYGIVGQLIFTVVGISGMISPSLLCYFLYAERWFIMLSTLMTMVLMVIGYEHLSRAKSAIQQMR